MNVLNKWEQKFGRLGIPGLMRYIIGLNILGVIIGVVNPDLYYSYLSLDIYRILHGQVWRLFTFLLYPSYTTGEAWTNLIWFAVWALVYFQIGTSLEQMWGTFRFTLFYFSGVLITIIVTVITYVLLCTQAGSAYAMSLGSILGRGVTLEYLNQTLFLAFAFMFPDAQFLFYFIIPVKAKWMSILYLVVNGYEILDCFLNGYYYTAALIVGALLNLGLFFLLGKGRTVPKAGYQQRKRTVQYKTQTGRQTGPRHRCAICGRTEEDAPGLEFRYCSRCEGNYEYCSDHLFTHEHVHR